MMYNYAEYEVKRDLSLCTLCGACVKQCYNGVHSIVRTARQKNRFGRYEVRKLSQMRLFLSFAGD